MRIVLALLVLTFTAASHAEPPSPLTRVTGPSDRSEAGATFALWRLRVAGGVDAKGTARLVEAGVERLNRCFAKGARADAPLAPHVSPAVRVRWTSKKVGRPEMMSEPSATGTVEACARKVFGELSWPHPGDGPAMAMIELRRQRPAALTRRAPVIGLTPLAALETLKPFPPPTALKVGRIRARHITARTVKKAFEHRRVTFLRCLAPVEGDARLTLEMTLDAHGRVTDHAVAAKDVPDDVRRCLIAKTRLWKLPAPKKAPAEITLPLRWSR